MPGYGVANPGSLIGSVCLVCCISTSVRPMRLSKFTPSLCTVEGGVFGGMYFYRNMFNFMPMPATPSCCSVNSPFNGAAPLPVQTLRGPRLRRLGRAWGQVRTWGWGLARFALVCFARSLRCFVCLLGLLLCACFRLSLPCWASFLVTTGTPFGSCLCRPRATALPLGPGG